jgi:hypothetical protein
MSFDYLWGKPLPKLTGQLQLLLRRELSVEHFAFGLIHKVSSRRSIFAGDTGQIAGNELFAEKKRSIRPFRESVIAYAEIRGMDKAAFAIEVDISFKTDGSESDPSIDS